LSRVSKEGFDSGQKLWPDVLREIIAGMIFFRQPWGISRLRGDQPMAYKSVCTFLASQTDATAQLDSAIQLAQRHDAHLEICALGIDTTQSVGFYAGAPAIVYQDALDQARSQADALEELARTHLRQSDIRWSVDNAVLTLGGINGFVGLKSRFCDLVVLPRPYGETRGPQDEIILEAALLKAIPRFLSCHSPARRCRISPRSCWPGTKATRPCTRPAQPCPCSNRPIW
jgi:hypothetical protein